MFGISYSEFLSCLAIVAGIGIVAYALLRKSKKESLVKGGEKVEGIVFETDYSNRNWFSLRHESPSVKDKITVRFVTKELVWVTADIPDDFTIYYTGQYKPGDKIKLIYNPKNPYEFVVETGQSEIASRLLFAVFGLALFLGGIYSLFFTPLF